MIIILTWSRLIFPMFYITLEGNSFYQKGTEPNWNIIQPLSRFP